MYEAYLFTFSLTYLLTYSEISLDLLIRSILSNKSHPSALSCFNKEVLDFLILVPNTFTSYSKHL